ncbi:uncharacterized protein LOC119671731 [Teleopsis dalmanni]|uniref:uncharacterized protein LOC119671659 n=1 Tax=Teleopsis dalmanni TaxID=139649 RepID=UPI000D32C2E7|nr:uncharacterized protein LOC119671659 [Teleopsis dalmanni]XP_037938423.1 uncharacterized protein LOC119671731 [Teleopsis dalmanni]
MKFFVFAFIASLCLVAVSSSAVGFEEPDEIELFVQDRTFLGAVKAALRTVKGFNCLIKWVLNIKSTTQQFLDDIVACGGTVSAQLQAVIDACNAIITTCNNIIDACGSDDEGDDSPSKSCTLAVVKGMASLYKQTKNVIKLIKKVPTVPGQYGQCVTDATNNLTSYFTQFVPNIKQCSKLTS